MKFQLLGKIYIPCIDWEARRLGGGEIGRFSDDDLALNDPLKYRLRALKQGLHIFLDQAEIFIRGCQFQTLYTSKKDSKGIQRCPALKIISSFPQDI